MSVRMASTCRSWVKARYSATVSAARGVSRRSIVGSSARLMNSTVRSIAPPIRNWSRKNDVSRCVIPMAAKTTANESLPPLAPCSSAWRPPTTRACEAICAASSLAGSPAPEKIGSFCPRVSVFSPSMAETPVWMNSLGWVRTEGLMGRPLMSSEVSGMMGGPPSMGWPEPLSARPSIESDTSSRATSPVKRTRVRARSRPLVPANTCTTPRFLSTSSTCPRCTSPSGPVISTISPKATPRMRSMNTSGPAMRARVRYSFVMREGRGRVVMAYSRAACSGRSALAQQHREASVWGVSCFQTCKLRLDSGGQCFQGLLGFCHRQLLHARDLGHRGQGGDALDGDARLHRRGGAAVELQNRAEHPVGFGQRTKAVNLVIGGLLQEVFAQHSGDGRHFALRLGQRVRPHQLHDLQQFDLPLEERHRLARQVVPGRLDGPGIPLTQVVERVTARPVNGREVTAAGEVVVQRPECAGHAERVLRHGLGEVAAGGRDRADHGHRASSL